MDDDENWENCLLLLCIVHYLFGPAISCDETVYLKVCISNGSSSLNEHSRSPSPKHSKSPSPNEALLATPGFSSPPLATHLAPQMKVTQVTKVPMTSTLK